MQTNMQKRYKTFVDKFSTQTPDFPVFFCLVVGPHKYDLTLKLTVLHGTIRVSAAGR